MSDITCYRALTSTAKLPNGEMVPTCFGPEKPWFTGPTFLHGSKNEWPRQLTKFSDPQEKLRVVHNYAAVCDSIIDFAKFSRCNDVVKNLTYVYHFVRSCRSTGTERLLSCWSNCMACSSGREVFRWDIYPSEKLCATESSRKVVAT